MKKLILFLLIIPYVATAQTGDKNFIDKNYIEVTGKAELEITPDLIYISILITEKDNKNKVSLAERENSLITKLKEIGIDTDKDLLIKDISSNFKYYLLLKSEILLSKEYQVLVRDGKTASRVFLELEKLGISNISIDKVDNSNMEKYRREVKINAIKASKEKAEALTTEIGQTAGRAIFIQELENGYRVSSSGAPGGASNILVRGYNSSAIYGAQAPNFKMDFEKIRLEYSILCRFELK